jgi:hypothetical protein
MRFDLTFDETLDAIRESALCRRKKWTLCDELIHVLDEARLTLFDERCVRFFEIRML